MKIKTERFSMLSDSLRRKSAMRFKSIFTMGAELANQKSRASRWLSKSCLTVLLPGLRLLVCANDCWIRFSDQLTSSLKLSPDNVDATIETLFSTSDRPFMTALIRLTPSTNPDLAALHAQEIYVIQGQAHLNGLPVSAGDYLYTESEPLSGTLQSDTGCLLLVHS
jgi:hypothetical protein